jgi:hypothetical protein
LVSNWSTFLKCGIYQKKIDREISGFHAQVSGRSIPLILKAFFMMAWLVAPSGKIFFAVPFKYLDCRYGGFVFFKRIKLVVVDADDINFLRTIGVC